MHCDATGKGMLRTFHVQDAFLSLLTDEVDIKFPRLRFGFIEAAAGWLPYLLWLAKLEGWNEDRKIGKDEMMPNLQTDTTLVQENKVTPAGIAELKKRMPYADFTEFEKDPTIDAMSKLFTVDMIVNFVEGKLKA